MIVIWRSLAQLELQKSILMDQKSLRQIQVELLSQVILMLLGMTITLTTLKQDLGPQTTWPFITMGQTASFKIQLEYFI